MLGNSRARPFLLALTPIHLWALHFALTVHTEWASLEFSKFSEKGLIHMALEETRALANFTSRERVVSLEGCVSWLCGFAL